MNEWARKHVMTLKISINNEDAILVNLLLRTASLMYVDISPCNASKTFKDAIIITHKKISFQAPSNAVEDLTTVILCHNFTTPRNSHHALLRKHLKAAEFTRGVQTPLLPGGINLDPIPRLVSDKRYLYSIKHGLFSIPLVRLKAGDFFFLF